MGQADERRIRRAGGRAAAVFVYGYGGRGADLWWEQARDKVDRGDNLIVVRLRYMFSSRRRKTSISFRV